MRGPGVFDCIGDNEAHHAELRALASSGKSGAVDADAEVKGSEHTTLDDEFSGACRADIVIIFQDSTGVVRESPYALLTRCCAM
jgi:hypothetical protein